MRVYKYFTCLLFLLPVMSLIGQVDTTQYTVYMGSRLAGEHLSWTSEEGSNMYYFTFNDRGRGPSLTSQITFDENGDLKSQRITGHDYSKNQVDEQFNIENGTANWSSASDLGSSSYNRQYYYPINGTIAEKEVLIHQIIKSGKEDIDLFPFGNISISVKKKFNIEGQNLMLYGLNGVSYGPSFYWMDDDHKLFAVVSPSRGISCIRKGFESSKQALIDQQILLEDDYYRALAVKYSEVPKSKTAITNVSLFDARSGTLKHHQTLVISGNVIDEIYDEAHTNLGSDIAIIDGTGKTLLPGFFDMHVHVDQSDGLLHLAGGVTSVRDMAVQTNYIDDKQKLARDFEDNRLIGPRMVGMCGFIDGNGPFTRDKGIDNVQQGLAWIDEFHAAGIPQIKLYSSIKPEWVRPLAEHAHQHGMIVSGHIPAFMTATQAIDQGYDEIQHTNMLFLNFYGDTLDTRNMTRFSAVGEQAHAFDFKSKKFEKFVNHLLSNETIVDPTMAIFEWGFKSVSGEVSPTYKEIAHRLPLTERRRYYGGGFARPPGMHQKYLKSYDRMVDMVYELHSRGVRIIPGTDNLPGFAYHRELELYVASGILPSEVLQLATIRSAEIAGKSTQLGSLETGKLADMVLIDGNPLENISAIRNTVLTIKDGVIYDPVKLYNAVGVLSK